MDVDRGPEQIVGLEDGRPASIQVKWFYIDDESRLTWLSG